MTPAGESVWPPRFAATARSPSAASWRWRSTIREHGYYRRAADPFGKHGDFFTAEQIQPVFGILMAARIRQLYREMGEPRDFTVVELGAGRREMAEGLRRMAATFRSTSIPASCRERFTGVVFSNEFFDALPVDAVMYRTAPFANSASRWRTALSAGRPAKWWVPNADALPAPLLPAARGRPLVRSEPRSARAGCERIAASLTKDTY